jgi:hypothetical protein
MNNIDKNFVVRLFAKFNGRYGQLWTSRGRNDADWEFIIDDWFTELSKFSLSVNRDAMDEVLMVYKDYPPTLPQLLDLCLKASGVPIASDLLRMLVNKDFSHPVVKLVYDKIGSWKLANGTEKELSQRVAELYDNAIVEYKTNPAVCWEKLETHKAQLALEAPIPDKIPSKAESKAYRDAIDECRRILSGDKAKTPILEIPEFDKRKINKGGEQYHDYCKYLLSVPDNQALALPLSYIYYRQKLLNLSETAKHLRECGYIQDSQRPNVEKRTSTGQPTKVYKTWIKD